MSSLKDALMKAGLQSAKTQNERKFVPGKDKKKIERHQEHRDFCEVCELVQPDVERFKHRMPTVDAEWICLKCADREQILDSFRITNQSEFARTHRYRRFYGPTKDFAKEGASKAPQKPFRADGNKGSTGGGQRPQPKRPNNDHLDDDGEENFNR